jgi:ABC-type nickel/cobalt efflux system permease component RcnA
MIAAALRPDRLALIRPRPRGLAIAGGVLAALLLPSVASAHPLGNFTINHYAGVRVTTSEIRLDVVIDQAEIPTFQERRRLDVDGDGDVSEAESAAAREPECLALADALELTVNGRMLALRSTAAALSFPLGAGLPTMRLECEFTAALAAPLVAGTTIEFADRSSAERLGWREIVVQEDGVTIEPVGGEILERSLSERLTSYPDDFLTRPLAMERVTFRVTPGGPAAPAGPEPAVADATAEGLPAIFASTELSLSVLVLSIVTAIGLGAGHALTPGHGKTLMAAYLVGTRGTSRHAAGLGLSVTISHTLGILVLAAIVIGAEGLLPPDAVAGTMPAIAGLAILAIGGWMVAGEVRRRRTARTERLTHDPGHEPARGHDHDHSRGHGHPHEHGHAHPHGTKPGSAITWRSLFALGLAGGIVPSTSALLILLGAIAAGRPAFGVVLVVAFGLGMAVVLAGVGVAIVRARGWVARATIASRYEIVSGYAPLVASIVVLGVGAWLTLQALDALAP